MTYERAAELISIEKTCVQRQDTPDCNRDTCGCQNCDLIQNTEEILEAYDMAIKALQYKANIKKYGSELGYMLAMKKDLERQQEEDKKRDEEFWKQINREDKNDGNS